VHLVGIYYKNKTPTRLPIISSHLRATYILHVNSQQAIYLRCDINPNMCNVQGNAAEGHRQSNAIIL
jgi:hypothetical protein